MVFGIWHIEINDYVRGMYVFTIVVLCEVLLEFKKCDGQRYTVTSGCPRP